MPRHPVHKHLVLPSDSVDPKQVSDKFVTYFNKQTAFFMKESTYSEWRESPEPIGLLCCITWTMKCACLGLDLNCHHQMIHRLGRNCNISLSVLQKNIKARPLQTKLNKEDPLMLIYGSDNLFSNVCYCSRQ